MNGILKCKYGFYVNKSKAMHDSSKNQNFTSTFMGFELAVTDQARDLKVMVYSSIKMSNLYMPVVKKQNAMPRIIRKEIKIKQLI